MEPHFMNHRNNSHWTNECPISRLGPRSSVSNSSNIRSKLTPNKNWRPYPTGNKYKVSAPSRYQRPYRRENTRIPSGRLSPDLKMKQMLQSQRPPGRVVTLPSTDKEVNFVLNDFESNLIINDMKNILIEVLTPSWKVGQKFKLMLRINTLQLRRNLHQ